MSMSLRVFEKQSSVAESMLRNKLQEDTDHQRSDRAVDHLNEQKPKWIGCLNPHVPESWIDPNRGEQESQKQRSAVPVQSHQGPQPDESKRQNINFNLSPEKLSDKVFNF
jgi:hypothetical protein